MALGHSKSLSEEVSSMSRDSNLQALTQLQDAVVKLSKSLLRGAQPDHQDGSLNLLILLCESSL